MKNKIEKFVVFTALNRMGVGSWKTRNPREEQFVGRIKGVFRVGDGSPGFPEGKVNVKGWALFI